MGWGQERWGCETKFFQAEDAAVKFSFSPACIKRSLAAFA